MGLAYFWAHTIGAIYGKGSSLIYLRGLVFESKKKMANSKGDKEESMGSQRVDQFVNLVRRRDREMDQSPSITVELIYLNHISRSHSRLGSHVSHE